MKSLQKNVEDAIFVLQEFRSTRLFQCHGQYCANPRLFIKSLSPYTAYNGIQDFAGKLMTFSLVKWRLTNSVSLISALIVIPWIHAHKVFEKPKKVHYGS